VNQSTETLSPISEADLEELDKLVNAVALSDRTLTLFAIAPESAPDHPVVKQLKDQLGGLDESFQFLTFFYSDNSLFDFLADLDKRSPSESGRRVILAFGLEQLPTPRMKKEMEQLNLGREAIFERNIVLIFWLNRSSFLNEFRSRASDFWDWRGKVAEFETRNPLLYPYLEWLIAENSYLKMGGVMQVNRQVDILLDRIYVSLQAEKRQQLTTVITKSQQEFRGKGVSRIESSSFDYRFDESVDIGDSLAPEIELEMKVEGTYTSEPIVEKVDLADVVRSQYACSVILGAPGAGKTTLLKYLALHFAKAKRDGIETVLGGADLEDLGKTRLPIYLKIANYAESLEDYPELSLLDYLIQFYRQWENYFDGQEASEVTELLLSQMQMGNCLILLDGLDEVFDQASRRLIVERINEFVDRFSHNKAIVTSRIAGYQEVKLSSRFTEFTITDLTIAQASQFLHRWCLAVEQAQKPEATLEQQEREGDRQAQLILGDIEKSDGVKRLTANPLLLTILALIHRNGERLPERRVKLYELAVQTLTADWQLSKKLPNAQKVLLPEGEVVELLAPMAYWMHEEKPSGLVTHEEVMQQLAPKLAELRGESPDAPVVQQAVEEFLRRVRETTGLFVERAPNTYGFMHLTFEEYFAARYIADNEIPDILALIQKHWHEPRWEEPILLALGYYGSHSPKLINRLVEQLFADLDQYQPIVNTGDIRVRYHASKGKTLVFSFLDEESNIRQEESETILPKLLLAGKVLSQAELNSRIRTKLVEKLILTYIGIPELCFNAIEKEIENQVLDLLRQIESFNQIREVETCLRKLNDNVSLPIWKKMKIQIAMLHLALDKTGQELIDLLIELVTQLDPFCFGFFLRIFEEGLFGDEIIEALEIFQSSDLENSSQTSLDFVKALSLFQSKEIDKAITLLESLYKQENHLTPLITWSIANCYKKKNDDPRSINYYQEAFEQLSFYPDQNFLCCFLQWWAMSCSSNKRYREALVCTQHSLAQAKNIGWKNGCLFLQECIADTYAYWGKYELSIENLQVVRRLYAESGCSLLMAEVENRLAKTFYKNKKYEEAIAHHEQSRDFYQQLDQSKNVGNQWNKLAECYREWGKYEQALECQQQCLEIRQNLEEQSSIAVTYFQMGRIYQSWGKYSEVIPYYEQSLNLSQQLKNKNNVANNWSWIANCYREWGKYEKALECQQQCLEIRQNLEEQSSIAVTYFQMGRIYQSWGKYAEAITYYEQSRDLNEQLESSNSVANKWSWIADCYRAWGKYKQALESEHKNLEILQNLGNQQNIANAYHQMGIIYQSWGKYSEAITYYEQSHDLYHQLENNNNVAVANLWSWIADCYRAWGKYKQALESEYKSLEILKKLDDRQNIANAYYQFGRIYQAWGKYEEAITYYEQSQDLYKILDLQKNVGNQLSSIASCHRDLKDYTKAIQYYQHSLEQHQSLEQNESVSSRLRQISNTQRQQAKYLPIAESIALLDLAEQNLQQALAIDTVGDYRKKIAYDAISLALLTAERLRSLSEDISIPNLIAQFKQFYTDGFTRFAELGQIVDSAEKALDIARAYLEIEALADYDLAVTLTNQSLQTFQDFNRPKLQASACKLLGEIYLKLASQQQPEAAKTAEKFLSDSLQLYRDLGIAKEIEEVEKLLLTTPKL
jgi:tetratricopeptide (TPR) repeat protein